MPDAAAPVVARDEPWWPLLPKDPISPPPKQQPTSHGAGRRRFPWVTAAGFTYLTFSSGMALHRSRNDPSAMAFVAFAYADLIALFSCLRAYEHAQPGSATRQWLKLAVWLLTAALTVSFAYKVSAVMPPPAAALVWVVGLATVAGGFAAFFCVTTTTPREMAVEKTLRGHKQAFPLF
nr:unnamed protein product [Digitaria exilis]